MQQRMPAHEFIGVIFRILGLKNVSPLLQRGLATLSRWSARPDANNPEGWTHGCIWQTETLAEEAYLSGGERGVEWARTLARRICDIAEMDCAPRQPVTPDQDTVAGECLQDYPALVAFHAAALDPGCDPATLAAWEEAALREIRETAAKCREGGRG